MATNVIQKAKIFRIKDINEHLTCFLCKGYLIDATTIIECLHSFCRSCLILHLQADKSCPVCNCLIHKTKPLLNIRSDATLQDLVFKLIPGLYQEEINRRKEFIPREKDKKLSIPYHKSLVEEGNDDYYNIDMYSLDENINIELKFIDRIPSKLDVNYHDSQYKKYFQCPSSFNIGSFKKFIQKKYLISHFLQIELYSGQQCLYNSQTLLDVASFVSWQREKPLEILFTILEPYFEDITDSFLNDSNLEQTANVNELETSNLHTSKSSKNKSSCSTNTDNKDNSKGKEKAKEPKHKSSKLNKSIKESDTVEKSYLETCNKLIVSEEKDLEEKSLSTTEKLKDDNGLDEMEDDDIDESRKDLMKIVDRACSKLILGDDACKDSDNNNCSPNNKGEKSAQESTGNEDKVDCLKGVKSSEEPICREMAEALLCLSESANISSKAN